MTDNLITHGQVNATHFLLLHKPTGLPVSYTHLTLPTNREV